MDITPQRPVASHSRELSQGTSWWLRPDSVKDDLSALSQMGESPLAFRFGGGCLLLSSSDRELSGRFAELYGDLRHSGHGDQTGRQACAVPGLAPRRRLGHARPGSRWRDGRLDRVSRRALPTRLHGCRLLPRERARNSYDDAIANDMAICIVDPLEPVDIHHRDEVSRFD